MLKFIKKTGGRNNRGRITVRHRGGGHKRFLRVIDPRTKQMQISKIEYDPNRTALIASSSGPVVSYQILGESHKIGDIIKFKSLQEIGIGESVYNVSYRPGQKGIFGKASGTSCIVLKHEIGTTLVRLPSKQVKRISSKNECIPGAVKNIERSPIGKAGRNRWLGIRPTVKGRAMNSIDHPNGGKTAGGGQPKTPWGKLAKWVPTSRSPKRS